MSRPSTPGVDRAENADGRDADEKNLVPSRRQYLDLKAQHPGAILLYRLGDFYETFDEDATILARDARIALTSRSFGRSGRAPMAGIPHHALNHYLARLLAAVHRLGECWGLAWVDVSTGEFAVAEFSGADAAVRRAEEVVRLNPAETLVPDDAPDPPSGKGRQSPGHLTRLESWRWMPDRAAETLCTQFRVRS